jgi:hypothetical protein
MQPNYGLSKWQTRYVRDLQSFTVTTTQAYRKGSRNEADDHLSRRADFYAQVSLPLLGGGDVPHSVNPQEQSELPNKHDPRWLHRI